MSKPWSEAQRAKFARTMAAKKKGAKRWAPIRTTALTVTLPEWTGFALDAQAVKIVVGVEMRAVILSPGRGGRALQRFVAQLPSGTQLELGPPSLGIPIQRKEAGPGIADRDVPPN